MPMPTRSPSPALLLAGILTLGACFDPRLDLDTTDESSSGSDSTGTESGSSSSDSGVDEAGSSGAPDEPPEITAFTINGTTMPAEQQKAGIVLVDVDAMDDIGIDRIEIYDGEELVATMTQSPYQAELLLSSSDNGTHQYSARAFDEAGQFTDSETIAQSVNIVGGAIIELREDIGEAYAPLLLAMPRLTLDDSGDVFITLASPPDIADRTRVRALRYGPSLSLLWESDLNPPGTSALPMSAPMLTTNDELFVGGLEWEDGMASTMTIYRADGVTGAASESIPLGINTEGYGFPVIGQRSEQFLVSPEPNVIEARTPDLASVIWTQEQFSGSFEETQFLRGIVGLDIGSAEDSLLTFMPATAICGDESAPCIRRISADGTTLWTRPAAGAHQDRLPLTARFDSLGRAITVWAYGPDGLRINVYDPDGALVSDVEVLVGDNVQSQGFAIDPQGNLVVVGFLANDGSNAWATRVTPSGEVLWSTIYEFESDDPSMVTGVAVSPTGRAYFAGISALSQNGLGGWFEFAGTAWVAEIEL